MTTPPWQQTTIVRAGVVADGVADGLADAVVQLGDRLAAGERDGVRVGLPVRHAVPGEELVERQAVAVRAGVVLAPAVVDRDSTPGERLGDPLGRLLRPRVVAGVQHDVAVRDSSPVSARRAASRSHCARPRSDSPAHVRGPPIERLTLAIDSPCRTSTSRVTTKAGASSVTPGHGTQWTFRSEARPGGASAVGSGQWGPGSDTMHRFTIRASETDPRAAAIAVGAASLGLPFDGEPGVADVVFVEGDLDDDGPRPSWARSSPIRCCRPATWDVPAGDGIEITLHPGVTDGAAEAVVHAAPPARPRRHGGGDRAAHRVPAGRRHRHPAAAAGRQPDHRALDAGAATPDLHPGLRRRSHRRRGDPDPRPRRRGLAALDAERALALDPAELRRDPRPLHGRPAATRPTSSSRRSPRRGASTAPTRRSAPRSPPTTATVAPRSRQLRDATDAIDAPFVRSAFVGNAGIVSFVAGTTLALKAETHNHPSAVEPFGGANTGVGGVIRDVLGRRPPADRRHRRAVLRPARPPDRRRCPTARCTPAASARASSTASPTTATRSACRPSPAPCSTTRRTPTNPLVFCGCIGVAADRALPDRPVPRRPGRRARRAHRARRHPRGDVLQRHDGRHHRRGRRGQRADRRPGHREAADRRARPAPTTCGRRSPTAAPAACRRRSARWPRASAPTSSSTAVPLKYPGLAPWEIWLSEAQERMVVAVPPDRLADAARPLRPPRRRARRPRRVHRRRPPRRAPRRRRRARPRHRVPPRRPAAAADGRRRCRSPIARPAGRDRRRPGGDAARPARPPEHRLQGGDRSTATTTRSAAAPSCARSSGRAPTAPPTASCSPTRATPTASPSASASTRGTGCTTPRRWPTPSSTRRSATSSPSAPTPTGSPCSTTSRGATRAGRRRSASSSPPSTAAATPPLAYGAPFVSGKDSLNNEYIGADGQRHAVPPTLVITAVAHVPDVGRCVTAELTAPGNVLFLLGAHGARVRRQPPRPRARRRRPSPGARAAARPGRPRPLPRACTARSAPGSCARATTSARAGSPWPSPRCASPGASAPTIDALPARRPGDGAVRRVGRPPRRRGRAAATSSAFLAAGRPGAHGSARSPPSRCSTLARRRRHRRSTTSPPPSTGGDAMTPAGGARRRRPGHQPRHRRRRSPSTSPAPSRPSCSPTS